MQHLTMTSHVLLQLETTESRGLHRQEVKTVQLQSVQQTIQIPSTGLMISLHLIPTQVLELVTMMMMTWTIKADLTAYGSGIYSASAGLVRFSQERLA